MDHPGFLLENLILSQNKAVGFRHTKVQLSCAICAFFFLFVKMKMMRKHFLMSDDWLIFSFSERGAHHRWEKKKKKLLVWEKVVHTSRHSMCLSVFSLRNEWRSKRTMWEVAEKPKRASTVAAETFLTGLFPHKMDQQPKPIWLNSNPVI